MARTDLSTLELPSWAAPREPREDAVSAQRIGIRTGWWRHEILSRGLPGEAPSAESLTRADVWSRSGDVFTLLWYALAWGAGRYLRQNVRRLVVIAEDVDRCGGLLTAAAERSSQDTEGAFAILRPGRTNAIEYLGPSFFTKFLYFAGGGRPEHPSLILDRRVATSLRDECGWDSMDRTGPWPADTYRRYCDLLDRWATDHHCAPDELERTLFRGRSR
ncbi:MAG TPA: hypothetical protein VGP26_19475 [Actinophytocola sp.]|jgi:hypothetical protein|nr:hypothetical protein [Actinophytocola sp.]